MRLHNQIFDLVIIGGGFVGATFAQALRSLPLKIALLEQAPCDVVFSDKRSIVLSYGSSLILNTFDLWQRLQTHATPIQCIEISEAGRFGKVHFSLQDTPVDALGYCIEASHLQQTLQDAFKDNPAVTYFRPAKLLEMINENQQWKLKVLSGADTFLLEAPLVVGADGSHSAVRQLQKIDITEWDYQQTAIVATLTLKDRHHFQAYERFIPTGALGILPLANAECGVVLSACNRDAPALLSLSDDQFLKKLQEQIGYRLGKLIAVSSRKAYPLKRMQAERKAGQGWVLLGNAAQTLHPIAAQGFNLGLRDVACLSESIAAAREQQKSFFSEKFLQDFVRARKSDQTRTSRMTHHLVHLFSRDFFPIQFGRDVGMSFLEYLPYIKPYLSRCLMGFK